jgi:mannose-6-phosphate isomerase-like protein (cupin superfamily)
MAPPDRSVPHASGLAGGAAAADPTAPTVAIVNRDDAPWRQMRMDRGQQQLWIGPTVGASQLDVHMNVLRADSGPGPYHVHHRAENVYIVLEGVADAVIDGARHRLVPGQVVFIPPGVAHSCGSDGSGPLTMIEIYSPAGPDFEVLPDPDLIADEPAPPDHAREGAT